MKTSLFSHAGWSFLKPTSVTNGCRFKPSAWMAPLPLALILVSAFCPSSASAQSDLTNVLGIPGNSAIYPIPGLGFVNLTNGNLHIQIPLRTVKDRNGTPITTNILYDNSIWEITTVPAQSSGTSSAWTTAGAYGSGFVSGLNITPNYAGTVTYTVASTLCGFTMIPLYTNWVYTDGNGTIHPFPPGVSTQQGGSTCQAQPVTQAAAADGSGYWLEVNNYINGTVYDTHGNIVTAGGPDTNGNLAAGGYQDRLGRSLQLPRGTNGFTYMNKTINVFTNFSAAGYTAIEVNSSATVLSSLILPDGRTYSFTYDEAGSPAQPGHYGTLTGITLPTGGQIAIVSEVLSAGQAQFPGLVVKQVTTPDGTWNFTYNPASDLSTATAPVDPHTGLAAQTTGSGMDPVTVSVYSGTASGNPLRSVTGYQYRPMKITTTLEDGKTSSVGYIYADLCTPRVSARMEYDYSGNLIRETDTKYYTSAADNTNLCREFTGTPTWNSPFMGGTTHITDIPSSITVYGPGGPTTTPVAQTTYTYDSTALSTTSGSVGNPVTGLKVHDDVNFGPSMTVRGNPTAISQMTTTGTFITTQTNTYNILGEIVRSVDGNGNQTSYDFTDSWNDATCAPSPVFAYPTTVTNAVGQVTKNQYNSCDGSIASVRDQNDINAGRNGTVFTYDALQRTTMVSLPDGGNIINVYSPANPQTITTTVNASPDPNRVSETTLDGLGRAVSTLGANGASVTTTYDSRGRVFSITNPTSTPSGTTTFYYDALNRPAVQMQQDGTTLQWCYEGMATSGQTNCLANKSTVTGPWVDYSDETSRHWQRVSDPLGRLAAVMEPNASDTPGIETDYSYDALNNLSTVKQNGITGETAVTRSFIYDGLSRLTMATNAESGATNYTYDQNGNVKTKVDARGSGTGGVWYCYEGLNRLTSKAYSQQNCPMPSPAVVYAYDTSSVSGNQNTAGRLTSEKVNNGATLLFQRQPYNYDPLGRIKGEQQCILGTCTGTPSSLNYIYDLAGSLNTSNNGIASTPVQLSYSYDAGGRLNLLSSSLSDANHPPTLFSAVAAPSGGCGLGSLPAYNGADQLQYAQIGVTGSQAVVTTTRCYDQRLRPTSKNDTGQRSTPGTAATTSVTISGTEASMTGSGTAKPATGTISLTYSGGAMVKGAIPFFVGNSITLPDGYHAGFIATANSAIKVANALAAVLNQTASPVTAVVTSGGTASAASLVLTTKTTGADQNGAITLSLLSTKVKAAPASLSGGGGNAYDTGTVTANIDGTAVAVGYSQTSTAQALAYSLATAISGAGAGVTATAAAGAVITVTDSQPGTAGNGLTVTLSSATNQPKIFTSASFSGTSGTLSGGTAGTTTPTNVYSYSIPNTTGYASNGNLLSYTDQITGGWTMGYDNLNRVTAGSATSGVWNNLALSWSYDSFGNRKTQTPSGTPTAPVPQPQSFSYPSRNQIANYGAGSYDAAGNVLYDLINHYLYDAEGRVCAVSYYTGTTTAYMEYFYDAEGRRVAKGSTSSFSCNPASNGFTLTDQYILGLSGETVSEQDGSGNFLRSNAYANGELLATYSNNSTYFALNDWLGSKRVVTNPDGTVAEMCMNLPFGDELICSGSDPSAHHFTGQLHDQESGNDYFGARYYANSTGRFMSPDFGGPGPMADPVPWADLENPQSLNLYGYVNNNPLSNTDDDGHDVNVCSNDGNGGQTCNTISNEQYSAAQKAGNSGLNVPTLDQVGMNGNGSGQFNSSAITDSNGNQVGSATYVSNGGGDYYANRSGLDYLGGVGAVMNRPSTYAAFYGASALGGAGLVAAGATAGELTLLGDISLTPTSGEAGYAQRLLAQGGRKSVEKAIRTLSKRLAEHQAKVGNLAGNPGSVEREIAGFTRTIEALKQVLR